MSTDEKIPGEPGRRKADDAVIIRGVLDGRSYEAIALEAGCSVSTVQRRLRKKQVKDELRARRDQMFDGLLHGQLWLADLSQGRLAALIDHEDPKVALDTIKLIFANAGDLRRAGRMASDLDDIRARLEQLPHE